MTSASLLFQELVPVASAMMCSVDSGAVCVQVALFDRIHNIRVKHIQEEYQKYMERVRSKAQSAIDQANANYQHHRAMLTARVDAMVHYLQQQYLRVRSHCPLGLLHGHQRLVRMDTQGMCALACKHSRKFVPPFEQAAEHVFSYVSTKHSTVRP